MADAYCLVGFQNHLRYGEQARVLRLIPGLENAEFLQFGQIHRNTFINSPKILNETLQTQKNAESVFCRTNHGRRRLCRIGRDGLARRIKCGAVLRRRRFDNRAASSRQSARCAAMFQMSKRKIFSPLILPSACLSLCPPNFAKNIATNASGIRFKSNSRSKDWDRWLFEIGFTEMKAAA